MNNPGSYFLPATALDAWLEAGILGVCLLALILWVTWKVAK